ARRTGNPAVEDVHLLNALLSQDEGVVVPVLQKVGVNVARPRESLRAALDRLPEPSGGSAQPTISRALDDVPDRAEHDAREVKDEYISTEHLLLGLDNRKASTTSGLLAEQGASRDALLSALEQVRGSHRVTDQTPETKYQAV